MTKVRIVGGVWRSRMLEVASVAGLRPTPDRVRETVFNWLGQDLSGWACLDLFAGSGALGFEAASRGASHVTLVEADARAHAGLLRAEKTLQASQVEIIKADAVKFATFCGRKFDLVFFDPPYRQGWLSRLLPHVDHLVEPDGWLYLEAEEPLTRWGDWRAVRSGKAGQVHFHLLRKDAE
ncbi:MAG: 16S rRNA (guanine(966)-N(2))-methyltransferase RsmD [Zoogloeaceae bacterium]|nr:16S rRNA (guanine(966)-N(2))-methyltransferase RsmD [Zoogloeaceae bacterium]